MRLNKKGLTYISVLAVFLLLAACSWNLFYFVKNYKLQLRQLEENRSIFYDCQNLAKEGIYFSEGRREIVAENISYQIETKKEGELVKVKVTAKRDGKLIETASKSKFFQPEKEIEEDTEYEETA